MSAEHGGPKPSELTRAVDAVTEDSKPAAGVVASPVDVISQLVRVGMGGQPQPRKPQGGGGH